MTNDNLLFIKFENIKVPEFKEVKGKDWISYGDNNLYPEYLIELALRSAKHSAILSGKVNYIYGGGLEAKTTGASLAQIAKANEFIRQVNADGFLRKMIQDFEWFNGFYVEPIFNKGFFEKLGDQKKLVFDFAEPADVEHFVYIHHFF